MAFQVSIKVLNVLNQLTVCHVNKFSTSTVMCKTIKWKELDKNVPMKKRWNYLKTKHGKIKPLDEELLGSGFHNVPFDLEKAHLISPKEVHISKWGGGKEIMQRISRDEARFGQHPGYFDADDNFVLVEEMIPEFVVPDLTDCKLRPYVPYNLEEVDQNKHTALDLFKATYGQTVVSRRDNMGAKELDIYLDEFLASSGCSRRDIMAHEPEASSTATEGEYEEQGKTQSTS